jgi:5-methylcytosine-specific restriction protein A
MARSLKEWIGKTDDSMPPQSVKDRIRQRQGNRCALEGLPLGSDEKVEYDHRIPLWLGGENRESNLQAVTAKAHKEKTAAEAKVRGKINRVRRKSFGLQKPKKHQWAKRGFDKVDPQNTATKPLTKRVGVFEEQPRAPQSSPQKARLRTGGILHDN